MFSQVLVNELDRPSLRFLWRGRRRTGSFDVYESPGVIFGAKSSPSVSEFCLRRTGIEFASGQHEILKAIEEDTYVDDIITGSDYETNAVQIVGLTKLLIKGGFELKAWATNSEHVRDNISGEARCELDLVSLDSDEKIDMTLGVYWNPS